MHNVPPRIASEISSRLTSESDELRQVFGKETIEFSGAQFEQIAMAVWMIGYADGIRDTIDDKVLTTEEMSA